MNDLREIRSKQADLSNAMRRNLPPDWWGRTADGNLKEKLRLGDRFKLCQVCPSSWPLVTAYTAMVTCNALRSLKAPSFAARGLFIEGTAILTAVLRVYMHNEQRHSR